MENDYEAALQVDYATVQDKNQLENMAVEHKSIINNLQIHELGNIRDKEQLERDIILNKMQENMLENTRQIISFKNLLNQTTDQHHKLTKQFQDQKDKTRKSTEMQLLADTNDLHKRSDELENEYRQLQEVEEKEQGYIKTIKQLQEELVARQYEHHDKMNKEEQRQVKENVELSDQNHQKISDVKKNVYHVAKNIVVEEKASNEEKHTQLRTRLLVLQQELLIIRKQRNEILDKRKELKINISINEEELEEYRAVGSLQKAKIKVNKDKIDQLKLLISEEVAKREGSIQDLRKNKKIEGKGLKTKLMRLEREQEQLKVKVEQMKVLADTILLQREEVQQFFIMSLEQCKKEIDSEKESSLAVGKEKEALSYSEKVDIDELSCKDKQRILTNLYTKLALGP